MTMNITELRRELTKRNNAIQHRLDNHHSVESILDAASRLLAIIPTSTHPWMWVDHDLHDMIEDHDLFDAAEIRQVCIVVTWLTGIIK